MLTGFQCEDATPDFEDHAEGDVRWIFMQESLFTLPEVYEEDVWEGAIQRVDDEETVSIAGDIPEDAILEEDDDLCRLRPGQAALAHT